MRLIAGLLGLVCLFAWGAQNPGDVTAGGEFIFRVRVGSNGMTVDQRVALVEKRLVNVLGSAISPQDITLKSEKGVYSIWVKKTLLITVTPEDAKAAQMTTRQLAEHWTKALRTKLPNLSAKLN